MHHRPTPPAPRLRSRSSTAAAAVLLLVGAATALSGQTPVNTVIREGDPAPGGPVGELIEKFAEHPISEQIQGGPSQPPARIDAQGNIAFHAFYGTDGLVANDPELATSAFFRFVGGVGERVVEAKTVLPDVDGGTIETIGGFNGLFTLPTPEIYDGRLAFVAQFKELVNGAFPTRAGIWSDRFGPIAPLVVEDRPLDGMAPTNTVFNGFLSDFGPNGDVLTFAHIDENNSDCCIGTGTPGCEDEECTEQICAIDLFCCDVSWDSQCVLQAWDMCEVCGAVGGLPSDAEPTGYWRDNGSGEQPVVISNQQAPGFPDGVLFGDSTGQTLFGPIGYRAAMGDGRIALTGFVKGAGVDNSNDEAIWVEGDAGLEVFLYEGTSVTDFDPAYGPQTQMLGASSALGAFTSVDLPFFDVAPNGNMVFGVNIKDPVDAHGDSVWARRDGRLELVARGSISFVQNDVPGTPMPGVEGSDFRHPASYRINSAGDIALAGTIELNGNFLNTEFGIWLDRAGTGLELVTLQGGPAPGFEAVATILQLDPRLELREDGLLLFSALVLTSGNELRAALYRRTPGEPPELVIAEGQAVSIDGGEPDEIVDLRMGDGTSVAGLRVAHLTFADGRAGLYTFQAADPIAVPGCPADLSGDGQVDSVDLNIVLSAFGVDAAGDINGDGDTNSVDLNLLLGAFGQPCM